MRQIGTYDLKAHLSAVLVEVEQGQTVEITRHGVAIARMVPLKATPRESVDDAVEAIKKLRRKSLGSGLTIRELIDEGRV